MGARCAFVSGNAVDGRNHVTLGGLLWTRDASATVPDAAKRIAGNDDPRIYFESYRWSASDNLARTQFALKKMVEFFDQHLKPAQ